MPYKKNHQRIDLDSNPGPRAYETTAVPLCFLSDVKAPIYERLRRDLGENEGKDKYLRWPPLFVLFPPYSERGSLHPSFDESVCRHQQTA